MNPQELEVLLAAVVEARQQLKEKGVSAYAKLIQKTDHEEPEQGDSALQLDKALFLSNR